MSTILTNSILDLTNQPLATNGSGNIISMNTVRSSVRTTMPTTNTHIAFNGNFTKLRSDTHLIATCTVYGAGYVSGNCGVGMVIDSTAWDHGCGYQYDGLWSNTAQVTIVIGTSRWTGIPSGTRNIGFGWRTFNGSATDKPFNFLNPNTSDADARNRQFISSIVIYEVIP
jgi:hypothetical protein